MTESNDKFEALLKKTINPSKCRESLVGNDYLSDVSFVLEETSNEFKAHKFFLMTASPVFHKIFSDPDMADDELTLNLPGISVPVMTEICRFAYSENVKLTKENMFDVLGAAAKFQMKFLQEKVMDFICKGMDEKVVFQILEANKKENNVRISMKCMEYIQRNYQKCFATEEFTQISRDSMRLIMQTCRIPKGAAEEAISKWSGFPDHSDDDIDELLALVSLNENVEEPKGDGRNDSDNESMSSHVSSRTGGSAVNGNNNRRTRDRPRGPRNFPQQNNNNNRNQNKPPNNHNHQPQNRNDQAVDRFKYQQLHPQKVLMGWKIFPLVGKAQRRSFKFANLNVKVLDQPILVHEVHFIYDLSATDVNFKFRIVDMTKSSTDLFYSTVSTGDKTNGMFNSYTLPRPCQLDKNSKAWFSIEFSRGEYRLTCDNFRVADDSCKDRLAIREGAHSKDTQSGQIISHIVFSDAPLDDDD